MMNYDLQSDRALQVSAIILLLLFCTSTMVGASLPQGARRRLKKTRVISIVIDPPALLVALFILNFFLLAFFLELGTTLSASYKSIKDVQAP